MTKVANIGRVHTDRHSTLLYDSATKVLPGTTESFQADIMIPPTVIGYTAIGNIISRHYYICLEASTFCCFSNPTLEFHTILNNYYEPELEENELVQPPPDWNPIAYPVTMKPNIPIYRYSPEAAIVPLNQPGTQVNMTQ